MTVKNLPSFFSTKTAGNKLASILYITLVIILFLLVSLAHIYKLDSVPAGLFFDESTIGTDAQHALQTGLDSHKIQLFFGSKSDFDSPILVYATVLMFKFFGATAYTLRLVNAIFFMAALLLAFGFAVNLFKEKLVIWLYLLIAFGFLPYFFTVSRLSFEVISQLAFTVAAVWAVWWTFKDNETNQHAFFKPVLAGIIIGISTYTYSTANMLSGLMVASLWVIYGNKTNFKKLVYLSVASLIALIPYLLFNFSHPGALTSRFREISFIFEAIPFTDKLRILLSNYVAYWSPAFLFLHGDPNPRHSTGVGGVIYLTVGILFVVGLISILLPKNLERFKLFLILNLLLSPFAAALTSEGTPHLIRSLLLGFYIILISCYGLSDLLQVPTNWVRMPLIALVFMLLTWEVVNYQLDYFIQYPARSVDAFGSYDLDGALEFAVQHNPQKIIFIDNFPGGDENLDFSKNVVDNPNRIPIQAATSIVPAKGMCVVYRRVGGAEKELDQSAVPYNEFRSRGNFNAVEKKLGGKPFLGVIKARCY